MMPTEQADRLMASLARNPHMLEEEPGQDLLAVLKALTALQARVGDDERELEACYSVLISKELRARSAEFLLALMAAAAERGTQYAKAALGNAVEITRLTGVTWALGDVLGKLTKACEDADAQEELPVEIDGSLLDAANKALALLTPPAPHSDEAG